MALSRNIHGFAQERFRPDEASAEFEALCLIADSLAHPQRSLLSVFVRQAVDREAAARFFLIKSCKGNHLATQEFLTTWIHLLEQMRPIACDGLDDSIKQDVRRRGGTGQVEQTYQGSLVFAHILSPSIFHNANADAEDKRLREMLAAFIGDGMLQVLSSIMSGDSSAQYLLQTKQAFDDFRNGRNAFKLCSSVDKVPTKYFVESNVFISSTALANVGHVVLQNNANDSALLQMESLLGVHHRLAQGFAWMEVAESMKCVSTQTYGFNLLRGKNAAQRIIRRMSLPMGHLLKPLTGMCQMLWMGVPVPLRAFTYIWLSKHSPRFFGSTGSDRTIRLPFGLHLRVAKSEWAPKHQAEFNALQLVQKWTQIPAPRAVDALQHAGSSVLLMTGVPGSPIGPLFNLMTDEQVDAAVYDLRRYLTELRRIPNQTDSDAQICNTLGAGILDWRIGDSQCKELKFANESEFNDFLTYDLPLDKEAWKKIQKSHSIKHDIVFTHADLNSRNILVDQDYKISGIVDWECAGWYPEYWECSKAHFPVHIIERWIMDFLNPVFPNYNREVEAEDLLAAMVPPW